MIPPVAGVLKRFAAWVAFAFERRAKLLIAGAMPIIVWTAVIIAYRFAEPAGYSVFAGFVIAMWATVVALIVVVQLRDVFEFAAHVLTGDPVVRRVPSKAAMQEFEESSPRPLLLFALAVIYSSPATMIAMLAIQELDIRGVVERVEDDSLFEKREQYRLRLKGSGHGFAASVQGAFRVLQNSYRGDAAEAVHQPH